MYSKDDIKKLPTLKQAIINNLSLNEKILLKCEKCGLEYVIKYFTIKNRKIKPNEAICKNCLKNMGYNVQPNLRPWQLKQYGKEPIPWELYLEYKDLYNKGCRISINITCSECNQEKLVSWRKIANRKYANNLPICNDCINKYSSNLEESRKINSEAQKIAQNKPETIIKRNKAVKKVCNTEQMKIKRKYNAKKLWEKEEYRNKIFGSHYTLKGYYDNIKFDSSYELSALVYFKDKITRCNESIPYFYNDEWHNYYPDYILEYENKKIIIEIKGFHTELVDIKKKYALKYIENSEFDDYWILYKEDLLNFPNFKLLNHNDILYLKELNIKYLPKNWKIKEKIDN